MSNSKQQSILVIGVGNMGGSIVNGLLANHWPAGLITICDYEKSRHSKLQQDFPQCPIITSPEELSTSPKVVLLAVKPHDMQKVCESLHKYKIFDDSLFITVAAGLPTSSYQHWLGKQASIIRCMPNTPAAIGQAITGLYTQATTSMADKDLAEQVLNSIGTTLWVDKESMLDAVTAVSGSGPAYFFYVMEGIQKSAQALGLSAEDSYQLTLQTMLGAANLAKHQGLSFDRLRENVTSKGGTTEQAINCFKQNQLHPIIQEALSAAADRAGQISQSFDKE